MDNWFDDSDPPGHKLDDEDIELAWSELMPGIRVRWKTPNFVRRGVITELSGRSMVLLFDGFTTPTTIPDAKWYWVQAKLDNHQEHMVAISQETDFNTGLPWEPLPDEPWSFATDSDLIDPAEAANIIGTDAKVVRRMIRTGALPATRRGGRWVILRSDALARRR